MLSKIHSLAAQSSFHPCYDLEGNHWQAKYPYRNKVLWQILAFPYCACSKASRIVSFKSLNTEEGKYFNTLQGATKLTNRKLGDNIIARLICLLIEQNLAASKHTTSNQVKMQE